MIDFKKLREPFPPETISWRVGSTTADKSKGMALAYIDARDAQDRLDSVCGPENWQCRYSHAAEKTICEIGIRVGDDWVWKSDGAGNSDIEAEKGALSDAFKRAAVRWGIGRYLYDMDSPWVAIETFGKSSKIKESELPRLRALLAGKSAPKGNGTAPDDRKAHAQAWVASVKEKLKTITPREFSDWHRANSDKIASVKTVDERLHTELLSVITAKQNQFHPMSA